MTIINAARWSELSEATPARRVKRRIKARDPEKLSERHLDVLRLMAEGLTDRQIGERLHIASSTVAGHTLAIYARLSARNRAHAVALAFRRGILDR